MADTSFINQLDPNLNAQLMTAQRQQALAKALMGQSLDPVQAPPGQNGLISPLSILTKALGGYLAPKMGAAADQKVAGAEGAMAQNRMRLMSQFLRGNDGAPSAQAPAAGGQPSGAVPTAAPQPAGAGAPPAPGLPAPAVGGVPDVSHDPTWQRYALGEQLGMLPQGTAENYAKAKYGAAAPTDQQKNDAWAGVTPAQRAAVVTGVDLKPDQTRMQIGPDGQPQTAYVAPNPSNNTQYAVGPGGQVFGSPVPGVVPARAALKGAETRAQADNGIMTVKAPDGSDVPVRAGAAATAGSQQLGLDGVPWTGGKLDPAKVAQLQSAAAAGDQQSRQVLDAYNRAQPRLGQSQSDKLMTDQGGDLYKKIQAENTNNQQHRQVLNEMYQLAQTGKFGPGTNTMARVKALAQNAGIDMTGAQTDQDVMKKLSANLVMSNLGQGGTGTDAQMGTLMASFPNGEMTTQAMKKVIPMLNSQIDVREARGNVANHFVNNGGNVSKLPGLLSTYNQLAQPGIVSLGRQMAEASKNGTIKQVVENLRKSYPNDYRSMLQRVQQLDEMGAF